MYSKVDDLLSLVGAGCVLAGVYMLFGLPVTLILAGAALIYTGWRIEPGREVRE